MSISRKWPKIIFVILTIEIASIIASFSTLAYATEKDSISKTILLPIAFLLAVQAIAAQVIGFQGFGKLRWLFLIIADLFWISGTALLASLSFLILEEVWIAIIATSALLLTIAGLILITVIANNAYFRRIFSAEA